jgi:hypothetical protein
MIEGMIQVLEVNQKIGIAAEPAPAVGAGHTSKTQGTSAGFVDGSIFGAIAATQFVNKTPVHHLVRCYRAGQTKQPRPYMALGCRGADWQCWGFSAPAGAGATRAPTDPSMVP